MMKYILIILLITILTLFSYTKVQAAEYKLMQFHAKWCGPCVRMSKVLKSKSITQYFEDNPQIKLYKVNVDQDRALANTWNVGSIPVVIITEKIPNKERWRTLYRHTGYMGEANLLSTLRKYVKKPIKKALTIPKKLPIRKKTTIFLWKSENFL